MRGASGAVALLLVASACGGSRSDEVFVGSASSFAHAIVSAREAYDEHELNVLVVGSQQLVSQLRDDAPIDVVVTADLPTMELIVADGNTSSAPSLLARNSLVIAVERDNPLGISSLSDLAMPDIALVLAGPGVPLGSYSGQVLRAAGVEVEPVSLTTNASAVAGLIRSGEADAGLVYETDLDPRRLTGVSIPTQLNVVAEYYIAPIAGAPNPEGAQLFIEFLLGPEGQELLGRLGFSV